MHLVTLTVREALDVEPLRAAGVSILAGAGHLDRPVRWAHVVELPDVANFLSGGELLLTTGMGTPTDAATQRAYLHALADAGAAALVIELGRKFTSIPGEMVRLAEARGLPLATLAHEARFVDVTEAVHRGILRRQYELLDRAEQVSTELTTQIIDGADVDEVVARVSGLLGADVVFEDEAHHIVAAAGDARTLELARAQWDAHSRAGHDDSALGAVQRTEDSPRCTWVDVWIRHERWGRLHVLARGSRTEAVRDLLVDRAGAALALAMLSKKDAAHLAERAESALLAELAAGRHASCDEVVHRARALGAELSRGRLAAVSMELDLLVANAGTGAITPSHRRPDAHLDALHTLAESLRVSIRSHGCEALVGTSGDRVVALIAVPGRRPLAGILDALVADAVEHSRRRAPVEVVAGASGEASLDALPRAIEEATVAAGFARGDAASRGVSGRLLHHYDELGTYQLLLRLADGPDLARFVDSELRPLLEHDERVRPKLVPTLHAYLAHAGRKADAARALGIQRRTLYQRMAKIESLLARSVDDQQTRTRLTLALQGLELLHAHRGRPAVPKH